MQAPAKGLLDVDVTSTNWSDLPKVDKNTVISLNRLLYQSHSVEVNWREKPRQLRFVPCTEGEGCERWGEVAWRGETLWIGSTSWDWAPHAPFLAESTGAADDLIPEGLASALAGLVLEKILGVFEAWSGSDCQFQRVVSSPEIPTERHWVSMQILDATEVVLNVILVLSDAQLEHVAERIAREPFARADTPLPVSISGELIIDEIPLSVAQVRSLRESDVIVLDLDSRYPLKPIKLHIAGCMLSVELLDNETVNNIRIIGKMSDENTDSENADSSSDEPIITNIDHLELTVEFELGRLDMSLEEIQSLREGYVFEGSGIDHRNVIIRVNGRKAGYGELIDLEGRVGVRIKRLLAHE